MSDNNTTYIWRCAKCSYHFANISKVEGILKEEKKCPKCKSLNIITLTPKEISIVCRLDKPEAEYREAEYYNDY